MFSFKKNLLILKLFSLLLLLGLSLTFSACTSSTSQWVTTDNNVRLFIINADSTATYHWDGAQSHELAHGEGILSISKPDQSTENYEISAYYGATDKKQIAFSGENDKYIGETLEDLMNGFGVLVKDNEIFEGNFKDGVPHGQLKWYKNDKLFYNGLWDNGYFNGFGILYKENGKIVKGEWEKDKLIKSVLNANIALGNYQGYVENNKPNGLGKMLYKNGTCYQGNWKNGKWHGEGLYTSGNDSIYGMWENGKANGDVLYKSDFLLFEGTLIDNIPTGVGSLASADSTYYIGWWDNGKRCGNGDMFFANGDSYSGQWENNTFQGYGEYFYQNDSANYKGQWEKGYQQGLGTYTCPSFTYKGEWEKGWIEGEGLLSFSNNDQYDGSLHENLIDGIGCYTFADGNFYEGEFVKGTMTGLGRFQFTNGNRFEGEFLNGKIYGDGTLLLITPSDTVTITGFWPLEGTFPDSASVLFSNGDLYEGPLKNGRPTDQGVWTSGEERIARIENVENSTLYKANELYKKHRETINWCIIGISTVVTAAEIACASSGVGAPIAAILHVVNIGINVVDIGLATASAAIDVNTANSLGEDNSEALKTLGTEVAVNAALILAPKALSKGGKMVAKSAKKISLGLGHAIKNVSRSPVASAALDGAGNMLIRKSTIHLVKGKTFGKVIHVVFSKEGKTNKIDESLITHKTTRNITIAVKRARTDLEDQCVTMNKYVQTIKLNPDITKKFKLSKEGSSDNLEYNMKLINGEKWVNKNNDIRDYLGLPRRQIEAHHIVPSRPTTPDGKEARQIWVKYFQSVDQPCNGIWLGKWSDEFGYKALAKGSNHGNNSNKYEEKVANIITTVYNNNKHFANNPEKMRQILLETVDKIKKDLYTGNLPILTKGHRVHTVWSIFTDNKDIVSKFAYQTLKAINLLTIQ